jgi:ribonuclease D
LTPWVRSPEELSALAASLAGRRAVALDTESDSLHHHHEKVCLIQLADDHGQGRLVDPLALRELADLGPMLADPQVTKVLHGADYDVTSLKRDFGFAFAGLFDSMIAARFLGLPEVGLQAVLRAELGVEVSKESQKDDWSRRPLTARQEAYALEDVRHLIPLFDRLSSKLRECSRLSWVEEECAAVAALEPNRRGSDPEGYLRIKGSGRLNARQQAVLRELFAWRERLAETTDIPAFKLAGPDALLAMAESPPRRPDQLERFRGLSPRVRGQAHDVVAAVERALALPEAALPRPSRPQRPNVSAATRKRIDALRAWRTEAGQRLALDVSIVLPQRLLEKVAEAAPADLDGLRQVEGIRRWRVETFGGEILKQL